MPNYNGFPPTYQSTLLFYACCDRGGTSCRASQYQPTCRMSAPSSCNPLSSGFFCCAARSFHLAVRRRTCERTGGCCARVNKPDGFYLLPLRRRRFVAYTVPSWFIFALQSNLQYSKRAMSLRFHSTLQSNWLGVGADYPQALLLCETLDSSSITTISLLNRIPW